MFIGQNHIVSQLEAILPYIKENHKDINLLLRGPSGYGKTELAKIICNFLAKNEYVFKLGNQIEVIENYWVHFFDEIHLCEKPEVLYPLMDSGKYVFVFATNYDSVLPEAFLNRCQNFIFSDYSTEELVEIFNTNFKYELPERVVKHIVEIAGRNPRIILRTYVNNLTMYFSSRRDLLLASSDEELINTIDTMHGIKEGLDANSRHYLDVLKNLNGRASLSLIAATMKLDINTIKYGIEPVLLYRGLIKISSKGRELC